MQLTGADRYVSQTDHPPTDLVPNRTLLNSASGS